MNWFHLLTIIFVIAKLVDVITWSWWLVLMPSFISIGLGVVALLVLWLTVRATFATVEEDI